MIRDYASDKVGPYYGSTSPLINGLQFSQQPPVYSPIYYPVRTRVECDGRQEYFMKVGVWSAFPDAGWTPSHMLEFHHEQFDERNFPWHFRPPTDRSSRHVEIEAMGAEDSRLYPDGMPASAPTPWWWWSATSQDAPVVQPLQWTRVGEGKWLSQPVSPPP